MRNILLITADQYRYDMLGHLGAHPVQTPNMDRRAMEGVRFDCAYFNSNEWDVFDLDSDPNELRNLRAEMRLADLPAPMQAAFEDISSRMEQWKDGSYLMNGKLRPMFT